MNSMNLMSMHSLCRVWDIMLCAEKTGRKDHVSLAPLPTALLTWALGFKKKDINEKVTYTHTNIAHAHSIPARHSPQLTWARRVPDSPSPTRPRLLRSRLESAAADAGPSGLPLMSRWLRAHVPSPCITCEGGWGWRQLGCHAMDDGAAVIHQGSARASPCSPTNLYALVPTCVCVCRAMRRHIAFFWYG